MSDTGPDQARAPALERWFARHFGDDAPRGAGTGWASGLASVSLGALALGAVVVLHFPGWLSTPGLRAAYPLGLVRAAIEVTIGIGFLSGCVNLLLRRRKTLGFAGILLAAAATLAGGGRVEIDGPLDGAVYFGFDWFLLNLLVLALVFVPLERLFPRIASQGVFRFGWTTDTAYFLVSHVAVQSLTFVSLYPATTLAAGLGDPAWRAAIAAQPLWLQVLEIMLVGDLVQYWVHRAFHRVPWLWRFHAIHHSSRVLDWLAGSRLHLVDVIVTRSLVVVPVFVLGFDPRAVYAWLVVIAFHAVFNHVNLRFRLGWVEWLLATPRFHHWHHAVTPPDRNFAVHFPWLDRLFGTHYLPGDAWPEQLGIAGHPLPEGFSRQLIHPFRRQGA